VATNHRLPGMSDLYKLCCDNALQGEADKIKRITMDDIKKLPDIPKDWKRKETGELRSEILRRIKKGKFILLLKGKVPGAGTAHYKRCITEANKYDVLLKPQKPPVAPESELTVSLTPEQIAQLGKLAEDFSVKDGPALARIWIVERLRQLH
jgi:hypothetical protein